MNYLLLTAWLLLCAVGLGVVVLAKSTIAGAMVIAVPTFVGMVLKPTFALCILMLVLPTGAGVAWQESFSLDRAVGLAVALSFFLNVLLTRPGLRVRHKALWVAAGLSLWIGVSSLIQPHLAEELQRAFTQFQLVLLILIVYWILETNSENTFRWALRCYTVGMVGSVAVAMQVGTGDSGRAGDAGRAVLGNARPCDRCEYAVGPDRDRVSLRHLPVRPRPEPLLAGDLLWGSGVPAGDDVADRLARRSGGAGVHAAVAAAVRAAGVASPRPGRSVAGGHSAGVYVRRPLGQGAWLGGLGGRAFDERRPCQGGAGLPGGGAPQRRGRRAGLADGDRLL